MSCLVSFLLDRAKMSSKEIQKLAFRGSSNDTLQLFRFLVWVYVMFESGPVCVTLGHGGTLQGRRWTAILNEEPTKGIAKEMISISSDMGILLLTMCHAQPLGGAHLTAIPPFAFNFLKNNRGLKSLSPSFSLTFSLPPPPRTQSLI